MTSLRKKVGWKIYVPVIVLGSLIAGALSADVKTPDSVEFSFQSIRYFAKLPPPHGFAEVTFNIGADFELIKIRVRTDALDVTIPRDVIGKVDRPDTPRISISKNPDAPSSGMPWIHIGMRFGAEAPTVDNHCLELEPETAVTGDLPCVTVTYEKSLISFIVKTSAKVSRFIYPPGKESEE